MIKISVILDATPDVSQTEQIAFAIRYVDCNKEHVIQQERKFITF